MHYCAQKTAFCSSHHSSVALQIQGHNLPRVTKQNQDHASSLNAKKPCAANISMETLKRDQSSLQSSRDRINGGQLITGARIYKLSYVSFSENV